MTSILQGKFVEMHDLEKFRIFFDANKSNESTSIIWIKINNKNHLQNNIGFLGYENLLTTVLEKIPSNGYYFDIRIKVLNQYLILACKDLPKSKAIHYLNFLHTWFKKNNFLINKKYSFINISTIILTDIPNKQTDEDILTKAEKELLKLEKKTLYLGESRKDEFNHFVKKHIFKAIENNDYSWVYQEIISTKNLDQESFQLKLVLNNSGTFLTRGEYYEIAKQNKLLKLFNTSLLNQATRLINKSPNSKKNIIVINQCISDFMQNNELNTRASLLQQLDLPPWQLYFQLNLKDLEPNINLLKKFSDKLKAAKIGICLADFNCSKQAWKIARKLNANVLKLKLDIESKQTTGYYEKILTNISQTFKKANLLGYKVFISKVDCNYFAADLWNLEVDYLQGEFIEVKESSISIQSYC